MPTEVHRVVLYVVDHDQVGAAGVREVLEHARYPNYCISPHTVSVETRAVEWADDHPLNMRSTSAAAFAELFPARPTPDEARRLVDALESRAAIAAGYMADYDESELDTARTALLRALGVEL